MTSFKQALIAAVIGFLLILAPGILKNNKNPFPAPTGEFARLK